MNKESNVIPQNLKQDILNVLEHVKDSLEREDVASLSKWSNHVIHSAAIYRNEHAVYVGIIAYSLSKSMEKKDYAKEGWANFMTNTLKSITQAIDALKKDDYKKFDALLKIMMNQILDFDKSFSNYVEYVLDFARVQKGTKIYEHGISLSSVAQLMGISKWALMHKVGETKGEGYYKLMIKKPKQRLEELKKIIKKRKG